MSVKLSQIAKQLGLSNKELRDKIKELNLAVSEKEAVVRDKVATEIVQAIKYSSPELKEKVEQLKEKKVIELPPIISVRNFSETLGLPVTQVIGALMKNGILATINEEIDYESAAITASDLGFEAMQKEEKFDTVLDVSELLKEEDETKLISRPPVVTILGHVDHGKTKILDYIRKTNVIETESGGITQKIGAYQATVKIKKDDKEETRRVTFLDTPGHEAFSAMRAHGVNLTDIAVLVVAADDGVKPQTIEAADHAKLGRVPIIVAINKIDKSEADIERVKRQLADINLLPEEWGGKTIMIPVSAKSGEGINTLLETIALVADVENLRANPNRTAVGVVIESHLDPKEGSVASVLVQTGTLNIGDIIVVGDIYGKVRSMKDHTGKKLKEALPATPVRITGFSAVPGFGDIVREVETEKEARDLMHRLQRLKGVKRLIHHSALGLGEIAEEIKRGELKELNIILKADSQGSLEAIKNSLTELSTAEVAVNIIHAGVGEITESDITMARTSNALVLGFKVKLSMTAKKIIDQYKVKVSLYEIIYQLIGDVKDALSGLLTPEIVEIELGRLKVLAVFKRGKGTKIIGGKVAEGKIEKGATAKVVRDKQLVGTGKITTLQKDKHAVTEVASGFECGLGIDIEPEIVEGDVVQVVKMEERIRRL